MEMLKNLIKLLNKHRTHYRDNTGLPTNKKSKISKLVQGFSDGTFEDEDSAAKALYGTDASHINFKRLKYRLQNRLLNSLLLIDPEKIFTSRIERDYFLVNQLTTFCRILSKLGEGNLSYSLAKSSLPKAKISFNPYAGLSLALILRAHASNRKEQKNFKKYDAEVKYYQQFANTEIELGGFTARYGMLIANPKTEIEQVKEYLNTSLEKIKTIKTDYSPLTIYYTYHVYIHDRLINRDIPGTIKYCQEGLKMMTPFNRPNLENLFHYTMMEAHISLKEFEEGKSIIFSRLKNKTLSNFNKLACAYYYAILCLTTQNYQYLGEALALFKEYKVDKSPINFFKENFIIFEMLYYILVTLDKITPTYPVKSKIRITKFINDLPDFSKDKKGTNTLILFVQLLLLLMKKDHGTIIDRVDNLKAYDQKYLRKKDSFRINCFLRMILLIPKHNFHPVAVQRHAAPYLKKLAIHKENNSNWKSVTIETIPYEDFWTLFIETLERNKKLK